MFSAYGSSATTNERGASAPSDFRPITCEFCGGDGYFCDDRPIPTPQGPHYGPDVRCTACNGVGEYEVEFVPVTEDDMSMEEALLLDAEKLRDMGVDVADPEFF